MGGYLIIKNYRFYNRNRIKIQQKTMHESNDNKKQSSLKTKYKHQSNSFYYKVLKKKREK